MKKVNPSAVLLSGVMMLRWLNENAAADKIEKGVNKVLGEAKTLTYDAGGTASTDEYADAIIRAMDTV